MDYLLHDPCSTYEGEIQRRWNTIPIETAFADTQKRSLVILSRGTWNMGPGPDFLNARIMIDGTLLKGDIEIHVKRSDWDRHCHTEDPAYANVILHVVEENDSDTRDDLPTFIFPKGKRAEQVPAYKKLPYGECVVFFEKMTPEQLTTFFRDAGMERMKMKSNDLLERMIREGVQMAFLFKLFEQAGSRKNRKVMSALYEAVSQKYPKDIFVNSFEAILWGESGLLPPDDAAIEDAESKEKIRSIWKNWWDLRPDAEVASGWNRGGTRPLNTPEREISAIIAFLRKNGIDPIPEWAGKILSAPNAEDAADYLVEAFSCTDPFWDQRTNFASRVMKNPARLLGSNRARTLAVDVAIPCLLAYAKLRKDEKLLNRIRMVAVSLPKTEENRITRAAFARWFRNPAAAPKLFTDACSRQGIHHIYTQYCEKAGGNCPVCLLRKSFS